MTNSEPSTHNNNFPQLSAVVTQDYSRHHIFIGLANCVNGVSPACLQSVLRFLFNSCTCLGLAWTMDMEAGTDLVNSDKSRLAAKMLRHDTATHLLLIDANAEFQSDDILKLLSTGKDIVAGYNPLCTDYSPKGDVTGLLQEVAAADTGFMLITRTVIERMVGTYCRDNTETQQSKDSILNGLFNIQYDSDIDFQVEYKSLCTHWRKLGERIWLRKDVLLRKTTSFTSEDVPRWLKLGVELKKSAHYEEALHALRLAEELQPDNIDICGNLAQVYYRLGQYTTATAYFKKIISLNPNMEEAYSSLGIILAFHERKPEEALQYLERLRQSTIPLFHVNLAVGLLLQGNLPDGFKEMEWRLKSEYGGPESMTYIRHMLKIKPAWQGENLQGKTIMVVAEQGFGDSIQFCRYLPEVKKSGGKVMLLVPPELVRLMQNGLADEVVDEYLPERHTVDYVISLFSLPMFFGTTLDTIPNKVPYLTVSNTITEHWRSRIKETGLKVGLVWSTRSPQITMRNLPLTELVPVLKLKGINFYNLTFNVEKEITEKIIPPETNWVDLTNEITDFADTAGIISNLDCIVTIDTAVAHLAGALGKPVQLLLPYEGEWRWLLDREDSLWYPSMRLLRQQERGQWAPVVMRLAKELTEMAGSQ